jgi:hypothetical protein
MKKFVDKLADHIEQNYSDLSKLTIVLPSQRAIRYIQRALFTTFNRPYFSPNFLTIEDFTRSFVDFAPIDQVELLFRFFEIYRQLGHSDDFETFLNWAPMLISDCNEIDRYMVDAEQLFKNLRDVREIENWSFGEGRELSENQKKFLAFWEQLRDFYTLINESLAKENLAYSGAISRKAVECCLSLIDELYPEQKIIFVGFNALSESEIQLINRLVKLGRAELILEADAFYLNNPGHEAGMFIRQAKARIPETRLFVGNDLLNSEKDLRITSCAQSGSMMKVVQNELSRMHRQELDDTVLLLADETLIVPAIKHIPKSVGVANITIGLPLKLTALRPWVELIFEFQRNFEYFKTDSLYHKSLSALLKHPFIELIVTDEDREIIQKEESDIIKFNKIFTKLNVEHFSESLQQVLRLIFKPWKGDYRLALKAILNLNHLIFKYLDAEDLILERSALFHFHQSIEKFSLLLNSRSELPPMNLRSFEKLFNMRWTSESLAYYGNPLEGLQIMGMLETRMLNFKNLIIVGLNEGVLPPKNTLNSLIPMDLRRFFHLPLPADKDAIFAHHFYRLFSGASRIHVLYSTNQGDDSALAEPSRYLQQVELELLPKSKIKVTYDSYNIPVRESISELKFKNSDEVRMRILDYFKKGLSPSALNKFIKCPLDFYVRYVLKYSDDEEVEEGVESSTFGNIIHSVLEVLYKPFVGETRPVLPKNIDEMLAHCDNEVEAQFKKKFDTSADVFERGSMYFAMHAAKKQVRRLLSKERRDLIQNSEKQLFIVSLEKPFSKKIVLEIDGKQEPIFITGKIDRIDRFGDSLRIIDYKTGSCSKSQVSITGKRFNAIQMALDNLEIFDFNEFQNLDTGYTLQLLTYLILYHEESKVLPNELGILSMRNLDDGLHCLTLKPEIKSGDEKALPIDERLVNFTTAYVKHLAEQILKVEVYEHQPKAKYCMLCSV